MINRYMRRIKILSRDGISFCQPTYFYEYFILYIYIATGNLFF